MTTVAIIGLGVMGAAAAKRLKAAGHKVVASDPAPKAVDAAQELGITLCDTQTAAFQDAEAALLFLPGPTQIEAVIAGPNGLLQAPGRIRHVVDHSTSAPETAEDLAELLVDAGIGWVDAPVLGRPSAIGNWALPCGSTPGALAACEHVFEAYTRAVFDVGSPGSGHKVKLLNQMMFGAINAMTAEMMAASSRLGIAPAKLFEIITSSQAGTVSNLFKELGARISEDDFSNPTFSVQLLEKDIRLGLEMAQKSGAQILLGNAVAAMNQIAIDQGLGAVDTAAMWKVLSDG